MALATAALVVVLLGVSADASADSQESLYAKESMLYEEILAGDSDEELVTPVDTELTAKTPALDVNADNGGPISVPAASVQSEVFKFGEYEFKKQLEFCKVHISSAQAAKGYQIEEVQTSIVQGVQFKVKFKFAGGDYSATVVRKVPANPTSCQASNRWCVTRTPWLETSKGL